MLSILCIFSFTCILQLACQILWEIIILIVIALSYSLICGELATLEY